MVYGHGNRQLILSKLLVIALLLVLLIDIGFAPAVAGYREIRDRNVSPFDAKDMTVDTGTREHRHATVDIGSLAFADSVIEVEVGTTVTWTNRDSVRYSITHGVPAEPGAEFDSGLLAEGERFAQTFTSPGAYHYFCTRHGAMRGVVRVVPTS